MKSTVCDVRNWIVFSLFWCMRLTQLAAVVVVVDVGLVFMRKKKNTFLQCLHSNFKVEKFQTVSEIHDILSNIIKKIKENSEYVMNSKQLFFAYLDTILLTFATYSAHHFPLLEFLIHIFHNISNFPHIHYSVMWKYLCEFFFLHTEQERRLFMFFRTIVCN